MPQLQDFQLDMMMVGLPWKDQIPKSPVKEQSVKQPPNHSFCVEQFGEREPMEWGQYNVFSSGKHLIIE